MAERESMRDGRWVLSDAPAMWTLIAGGDCALAGSLAPAFTARMPERAVDPALLTIMRGADAVLVNLEMPLTDTPNPIMKSGPHLRGSPRIAAGLAAAGITHVTLANNHIMDHGVSGLITTMRVLDSAGIAHHGAGATHAAALVPLRIGDAARPVVCIAVAEGEFARGAADAHGVAWCDAPESMAAIHTWAKRGAFVVVSLHHGHEYQPFPSPQTQRRCRAMIDAGARCILGHHPHVVQGIERYREGIIVHSLGNFLFDDCVSTATPRWRHVARAVLRRPLPFRNAHRVGFLVELQFGVPGIVALVIHPFVRAGDGRLIALRGAQRDACLGLVDDLCGIVHDDGVLRALWEDAVRNRFHAQRASVRMHLQRITAASVAARQRAAPAVYNSVRNTALREEIETVAMLHMGTRAEPPMRSMTVRDIERRFDALLV